MKKKKKINPVEEEELYEEDSDDMDSNKADSEDSYDDFGRNQMSTFYNRINENKEYFYEELMALNDLAVK